MAERNTIAKILKAVRAKGGYAVKINGNAFQPKTIDVLICYKGRFIGVEAKEKGNYVTERQKYTLHEIEQAGGQAVIAYSVLAVLATLELIDTEIRNGKAARARR